LNVPVITIKELFYVVGTVQYHAGVMEEDGPTSTEPDHRGFLYNEDVARILKMPSSDGFFHNYWLEYCHVLGRARIDRMVRMLALTDSHVFVERLMEEMRRVQENTYMHGNRPVPPLNEKLFQNLARLIKVVACGEIKLEALRNQTPPSL